jgi:RNA polymerase sigma factor (sigma-70 family)
MSASAQGYFGAIVVARRSVLSSLRMASSSVAESVLAGALGGDADAMDRLIEQLAPAVHAEVGAMLRRRAEGRRDPHQEIEDIVQDVFAFLFAENARALRAWRPDGGRTLLSFVRLLARHQTISILRNAKRNPWTDEPMSPELVADAAGAIEGPEQQIASREMLNALLDRLLPELTPRGMLLFQVLYVERGSAEAACVESGLSIGAVYSWRKRVKRTITRLLEELEGPAAVPIGEKR